MEPVPEVEMLRLNHRHYENIQLIAGSERSLDGVRGDCLELDLEIDAVVENVRTAIKSIGK